MSVAQEKTTVILSMVSALTNQAASNALARKDFKVMVSTVSATLIVSH